MNEDIKNTVEPIVSAPRTYAQPLGNHYTIYLTGELLDAGEYSEEFYILKNATPNDLIDVEINGYGGDLFSAVQFYNLITTCQASVRTTLQGMAYSAHSMIFLAGHEAVVMPNTSMLVHNGITGADGKIEDALKSMQHMSDFAKTLLYDVYKGFLTEEEIVRVIDGYQHWILTDEIVERMQARAEAFEKENSEVVVEGETGGEAEEDYPTKDELVQYIDRIHRTDD